MADDAELAFLEAQKEYDPTADYQPTDGAHNQDVPMTAGDDEEYDPALAFSPQAPSEPSDSNSNPPEAGIEAANAEDTTPPISSVPHEDENGLQAPPSAPTPSKQPRTMGGFVVESEDDEDEEPVAKSKTAGAALLNASGAASNSPQRSLTHTPNNTLAQNDVQLHSAQDQGASIVSSASIAANEPLPAAASTIPNGGMPVSDSSDLGASVPAPHLLNLAPTPLPTNSPLPVIPTSTSASTVTAATSLPQARLPHDRVGILEDRIAEDPRGDIDAWLSLIDDYRRRHKEEDARAVFERFFKVFPAAGEQWIEYVKFETELEQLGKVEQLFGRAIPLSAHVPLYKSYIDYTRRRFNLITDQSGQARSVLTQVYEFVLDQVGIDIESGQIWLDYIEMLKSGPGTLGGTAWQDMQKMDTLRKLYQRAVSVPHGATLEIWRDYDRFEMSLNKTTGRKNLQDKSAAYMTARSAINVLDNVTKGVNRTTLPKLPPAPGFDGHDDYMTQVKLWKNWIQWEKSDPLECAADDKALYHKRILHLYKSALMALRYWPELWFDAAEWCFQNDLQEDGDKFLNDGIDANPESCLLAFRKGYQVELRTDFEEGEQGVLAKGKAVREPYNKVLDALYELTAQTKKREEHSIARAKEAFEAQMKAEEAARANDDGNSDDGDDDEVVVAKRKKEKEDAFGVQVQAISAGYNAQVHTLKKTLTFAWIALMRAMRRVQGKGSPGATVPGFRGVFAEARKKGKLLSDAYVASALIEHHCYQDPAANKIFERGMKLFPDDEQFALEYIKHLIKINDSTNARAVFETVVTRLITKPENIPKVKPLFVYFHEYESQFGELAQILKLEQRMATLFPEDPQLQRFAERFAVHTFDPTTVRPIISPRTQMRPVMPTVVTSIEEPLPVVPPQVQAQEQRVASPAVLNSPRLTNLLPVSNSPKRPLEDADDGNQPRKLMRGESPLKGAAGRRLDAARRNLAAGGNTPVGLPPAPLPREITFLLSIIPAAHTYKETRFNAERMVAMLRGLTTIQAPPGTTTTQQVQPQSSPANRWGTTTTTAAQLQDIQARYGQAGPAVGHGGWGA